MRPPKFKMDTELKRFVTNPTNTVVFEQLDSCPTCNNKDLVKLGKLPDNHDTPLCLDAFIICGLLEQKRKEKSYSIRNDKLIEKVIIIRRYINVKRVAANLPPIHCGLQSS